MFKRDNDDVQRVREASDIVRIVGEVVALRPKGREFVGLCPFHDDHKPSMNVIPHKQLFHCFVCGTGGDALTFVRKFHAMEFREALEYLADKAGIELAKWVPNQQHAGAPEPEGPTLTKQDLVRANGSALDFFCAILRHPEHGSVARALVQRRGISPEMVELFQIGAAPDRWDGLARTLESKSLPMAAFEQLGLVKQRETGGGVYDAQRNRLIFPIHDQGGRPIAFGGRRINDEDEPKYINSPDTRLFNKSKTLYGLHLASREIQKRGIAVICEGYMDVVACHQAGITNSIGVLGTALTREHAAILRRLCHTIVLLFDGDDAGQRAADRSIDVFFAEDLDVKIATLSSVTDAKDPDELLKREGGVALLDRAIASARDIMEYRYRRLAQKLKDAGPAAMSRAVEDDLRHLGDLGLMTVKPVRRQLIFKKLSEITGVNVDAIIASRSVGRSGPVRTDLTPGVNIEENDPAKSIAGELALLARGVLSPADHLLGCAMCRPELLSTLQPSQRDLLGPDGYRSALVAQVAQTVFDIAQSGETPDLSRVVSALESEAVQAAAVTLATRIERETDNQVDRLQAHWEQCLVRLAQDQTGRALDGPPLSAAGDFSSLQYQLEQKRRDHATLGGDRRVLPKPK